MTDQYNDSKKSDDLGVQPIFQEDEDAEDSVDSQYSAAEITEPEQAVVTAVSTFGLDLHDIHQNILVFHENTQALRPARPARRVAIPRTSLSLLGDQLADEFVRHPSAEGIVVPVRGYAEVFLGNFDRYMRPYFAAERILELDCDEIDCAHSNEPEILPTIPYEGRYSRARPRLHLASPDHGRPCVEVSNASPLALLLYGRSRYSVGLIPTVKISFASAEDADKLITVTDDIIRSLLFELDVRNGRVAAISRTRTSPTTELYPKRQPHPTSNARYPKTKVQEEVAALFNFASQARDNPPLGFLSYYQTLEYFIPAVVRQSAFKKIRQELHDPFFDENSDESLMRIISATERSVSQSEANQLRILVQHCVRSDRLVEFFNLDWGSHFRKQGPIQGAESINTSNSSKQLSDQVADRIYQIRNRIVHAKDDPRYEDSRVLLPRSAEADALGPDIQLVRLVAIEAILAGQSGWGR